MDNKIHMEVGDGYEYVTDYWYWKPQIKELREKGFSKREAIDLLIKEFNGSAKEESL